MSRAVVIGAQGGLGGSGTTLGVAGPRRAAARAAARLKRVLDEAVHAQVSAA